MTRSILSVVAGCMMLTQCTNKADFDDLGGSSTLKGVAIVYDTLNGVVNLKPLKNAKIFLKYTGNTSGFIYSTNSNAAAEYTFTGIDAAKLYTVYASTDTGTVKYYGEIKHSSGTPPASISDTLRLYPSAVSQNGIHLIVRDAAGAPVGNVTAWVFNSPVLFAADTSAGKIFDMTTNQFGVANIFNLADEIYYLRIKTKIGNLDLTGEASVVLPEKGIHNVIITIRNIPLARNGMEIQLRDIFNTPIHNAKVYCYRSFAIFLADTINYNNYLFPPLTSNQGGLASAYIVEPATYYLRAIKVINSDTLKQTGTIVVTSNAVSTLTMTLQ